MRFNKIRIAGLVMIVLTLLMSGSVSALQATEAHGVSMPTQPALTEAKGLAFTVNETVTLLWVNMTSGMTATKARLKNATNFPADMANATFVGNIASFNATLHSGGKYYVILDSDGASYIPSNEGGASINGQAGTFGTWTGCYYGGAVRAVPCVAVNLESMTLTDTLEPPPDSITINNPANGTTVYDTQATVNVTATITNFSNQTVNVYDSLGALYFSNYTTDSEYEVTNVYAYGTYYVNVTGYNITGGVVNSDTNTFTFANYTISNVLECFDLDNSSGYYGKFNISTFTGSYATGIEGDAAYFSGANYSYIPITNGHLNNFTIVVWKWHDSIPAQDFIYSMHTNGVKGVVMETQANGYSITNAYVSEVFNTTSTQGISQSNANGAVTGSWQFLGHTYNNTYEEIWINGERNKTYQRGTEVSGPLINNSNALLLGAWNNSGTLGSYFSGRLDVMIVYTQALKDEDFTMLYNEGTALSCNALLGTVATNDSSTIVFQGQTPTDNAVQYYTNNNITINTTTTNFGGTVQTSHYLYNGSGSLVAQNNQSSGQNYTSSFTSLGVGKYTFNASATNTTTSNITGIRTLYIYDLTAGSVTVPTNASDVANRYLNITWSNGTINPTTSGVTVSNFTLYLYNSTYNLIKTFGTFTQLNFTNWDVYSENLSIANYNFLLNYTDSNANKVSSVYSQFNLTRNTRINITAISALSGASINVFNGWVYQLENDLNVTYNTTNGQVWVEHLKGNLTIYIDATNYSLTTNTSLIGVNVTTSTYDQQFSLVETNTLNITFYDENDFTTILNTTTITMDLISTLYSNNYTTTNGTLYLNLLTAETYTLRYIAPGYTERFYEVTVKNRSFQNIQLYLLNDTKSTNITIYVVNEVLNPVEGAIVKALKYDLTSNTYILQEIATTDVIGKVIMSLTFNDEYYKFIVEYDGETKKTTNPAYITENPFTIPITFGSDVTEEYNKYYSIQYSLSFTDATSNFRFEYNDINNVASEFCVYVYKYTNNSRTSYNDSCTTGSSGTILVGVENITGTTYYAMATYNDGISEKFLAGLFKEFPGTSEIGGLYGLLLQLLLTIFFASISIVSGSAAVMLTPFSLIIGHWIGINTFPMIGLIPLQVAGIIMGILLSMKK